MNDTADTRDEWANLGFVAKAALVCAGTFAAIGLFAMGAALPELQRAFAATPNATLMVQIMGGIVAPAFALASPFAGRLVERHGVRKVYLGSLVLFVIGGLGPMICSSLMMMLPFRIVLALGVAGGMTAGYAGVARVPASQRQIMLGLMSFVGGGITILAYPMVGTLAGESWDLAFLVHLILVPLGLLALALPKRDGAAHRAESAQPAAAGKLLAGVPLVLLLIATIGGWGMVGTSIYSPFYLASIGVTDPASVGNVLAVMSLCSLAGSGTYGFVHRLLGTRGMVLFGLALCSAGCAIIAMNDQVTGVIAGLGMLGAGLSVFSASAYAAAIESIGAAGNVGAAMGVMNFALFGPQILFPPLATAIAAGSSPAMVYITLASLFVLCIVLVLARPLPIARRSAAASAG